VDRFLIPMNSEFGVTGPFGRAAPRCSTPQTASFSAPAGVAWRALFKRADKATIRGLDRPDRVGFHRLFGNVRCEL